MERTREKFNKFSHMVMKEADEKKKVIIAEAEMIHNETIASGEIQYLKEAYERIQEAVRKLDKEVNEEISKAILESKQALFNRRDEIINAIFQNVRKKLQDFKQQEGYKGFIEDRITEGLLKVGKGDIRVLADPEDFTLLEEIRVKLNKQFEISESEEQLLGGFLIMNREKGFMCDYSFISRLNEERLEFLENYEISLD